MRTLIEILAGSPTPGPLGLSHQRARRAADPRPRRAMRHARHSLARFEAAVGPGAALIKTRNRPIGQQEGTNEQPGSWNHRAPGS